MPEGTQQGLSSALPPTLMHHDWPPSLVDPFFCGHWSRVLSLRGPVPPPDFADVSVVVSPPRSPRVSMARWIPGYAQMACWRHGTVFADYSDPSTVPRSSANVLLLLITASLVFPYIPRVFEIGASTRMRASPRVYFFLVFVT